MSKLRRALTGFKRTGDTEILMITQSVLKHMKGNEYFQNLVPNLELLEEAKIDYEKKLSVALLTGGKIDRALKNASKDALGIHLHQLAMHVNIISKGNEPYLLSSGFDLTKTNGSIYEPDVVTSVKVVDGIQSGKVNLTFKSQPRVLIYEYCHTTKKDEKGNIIWDQVEVTSNSRKNIIEDVTPYMYNYFRVRAVNRKGKGEWSEAISFFVR